MAQYDTQYGVLVSELYDSPNVEKQIQKGEGLEVFGHVLIYWLFVAGLWMQLDPYLEPTANTVTLSPVCFLNISIIWQLYVLIVAQEI